MKLGQTLKYTDVLLNEQILFWVNKSINNLMHLNVILWCVILLIHQLIYRLLEINQRQHFVNYWAKTLQLLLCYGYVNSNSASNSVCLVPKLLVDLHVKLLRKIGKSVSADRWEKNLIKVSKSVLIKYLVTPHMPHILLLTITWNCCDLWIIS